MTTYLVGASVVDIQRRNVDRATTIAIDGGRIAAIGGAAPRAGDGATVVDVDGAFVVPGLWNVHTHMGGGTPSTLRERHEPEAERTIRAGRNLLSALARGVTGVRNVLEPAAIDLAWRNAIRQGQVLGPNVFVCGQAITPTGGHVHDYPGVIQADGPAEFRKAARSQLGKGVDQLKVMVSGGIASINESLLEAQALPDEIAAVVAVAHRKGKRVTVHAGGSQSIREAVLAGVDCIEHGYELDDETVALMLRSKTFYVPTLFVTSEHNRRYLVGLGADPVLIAKADAGAARHVSGFRIAREAGVKIVVGADVNPIGENTFIEAELLVREGMAPIDALRAATLNAAELCGIDGQNGSVDVGKVADLLVVRGDPLEDIRNLRNTLLVLRAGRVVSDPERLTRATMYAHPFLT